MTLLVCVDKKNGMAFHQRRQSMDRLVRADILSTVGGKALWMTPYSARQFVEPGLSLHLADAPAAQAGTDDRSRAGLHFTAQGRLVVER